MLRAVYVDGFGVGRESAEGVGRALEKYYEVVDPFTYSDSINSPDEVIRAAEGVDLWTDSAGALILPHAQPHSARILSPPLPKSLPDLAVSALGKTMQRFIPGTTAESRAAKAAPQKARGEVFFHPAVSIREILKICKFHAIEEAIQAMQRGILTRIVWTTEDHLFRPSAADLRLAEVHGVPVSILEGQHSEIALRPEEFLAKLFSA